MVASTPASGKRVGASSQPEGPRFSPEEMAALLAEQLSEVEQELVSGQVKSAREKGKIPRALNQAIFVRAVLCRFRKMGEVPPPHVPHDAWQRFLLDSDATAVRAAMTSEQTLYWEYRTDVLAAHHITAFPNYKYAPKHLPRAEKARKIEAANRLRAAQGKSPLAVPRRGRPPKKAGTEIEVPTVPAVPALHYDAQRDVSPTSSSSDSFPLLSVGTPSTSSAASMFGNELGMSFPLAPTNLARDDAMLVWDMTQVYRRNSQVALENDRGAKSDRIANIALPHVFMPQQQHMFAAPMPPPNQFSYPAAGARRTSVSEVVHNYSARRNSEFRFLPMPQGYMHQEPMMAAMPLDMPMAPPQGEMMWSNANPFTTSGPSHFGGYAQSYQPSPLDMPSFQPQQHASMLMTPVDETSSQHSDVSPTFTNPFATGPSYGWAPSTEPIPLDNGLEHLKITDQTGQASFFCDDEQTMDTPDGLVFSGLSTSPPASVHGDETPLDITLYA